jgi:hypothetical protein
VRAPGPGRLIVAGFREGDLPTGRPGPPPLTLLPAGAVTHRVYLAAVGVVIVLLSLVWAMVSWRRYVARIRPARSRAATTTAKGAKHQPGQTRRVRMMKRMEERLRRRQEGNGGMPRRARS